MSRVIGEYRVGEDMRLALDAVQGDVADIAEVTARMLPAIKGPVTYEPNTSATPIVVQVSERPAAGEIPAGWNLLLAASATADLEPGVYVVDAKFVGVEDTVDITDTSAVIRFTKAAVG